MEVWGRIREDPNTWEVDVPRQFIPSFPWKFYNELVLEYATFYGALPWSMEAMFYIRGNCDDPRPQPWIGGWEQPKCEEYARWAHGLLAQAWPAEAEQIPLLRLDVYSRTTPFVPDDAMYG